MKYRLIKREPNCCVPRCIQTILGRYNIPFDSQVNIAKELGLNDTGTHIEKEEYGLQNYFNSHLLPFKFEYNYIVDYDIAKKFILDNINKDIIVCYKRGAMFNKKMDGGHSTLIDNFDGLYVTLLYPEDEKGYRKVTLDNLLNAIKEHEKEKLAGFWLITKL